MNDDLSFHRYDVKPYIITVYGTDDSVKSVSVVWAYTADDALTIKFNKLRHTTPTPIIYDIGCPITEVELKLVEASRSDNFGRY